ncbi:MAG: YceI family protein [Nitrospirota bacterium]
MTKCIIDPDHSVASFAIRHMMIANVRGMFNKVKGTIHFDSNDLAKSSVEAEIDVASLSTGVKKRDQHILSDEMLDAGKYPTITFKSTKVEPKGGNRARIHGNLTIHGVTRPIVMDAEHFGPVKSPFGGEIALGFTAITKVNREDFGVMWGSDPMEGGGLIAGKEAEITLDVEADLVEG